ncbi:MAG: phosphatidate cytidylyltransferase [Pseudomonadota bacterium]|nr:phosphatidate cytidylyltransferase [Pseudomonadota bacterium]MEE3261029.1 phosphatidate cytidylyltransferase [Pseudomonadota bacterium]
MVPVVNELLKSNLALRVFSALFLAGVTIVGLFHGSPLFEALLFIAFLFLMYELKKLPFKGQGSLFVALYLVISFLSVYWLFDFDSTTLLWLFCIVWSSDIGGYCAGKFFGGPKVLPKVSPNKTWAGVLGACFLTFFSLILLSEHSLHILGEDYFHLGKFVNDYGAVFYIVSSLIFSLLSQIGDFLESYIKRQLGIKDTGSLIPGHGGLFDRLDGLIFVAPIFALFIYSL